MAGPVLEQLNLIVGNILWFSPGNPFAPFAPLFETTLLAEDEIASWGYTYIPCSLNCPDDGVLFVNAVP